MDLKPIKSAQPSTFQNDRVSALLSDFLSRRSERTRVAYGGDLAAFAASTGQPSPLAAICFLLSLPAGEANGAVLRYRSEMIAAGLSSATVNRRLAAVRSVVKLARTLGLVSWSIEISGESARAYRDTSGPGRSGILRILSFLQARAAEAPDKTVQEQSGNCFQTETENQPEYPLPEESLETVNQSGDCLPVKTAETEKQTGNCFQAVPENQGNGLVFTDQVRIKARRDLAVFRLLLDVGLRRGEIASLYLEDVDMETGKISVLGKGRTGNEPLTLPEETKTALRIWIQVRGEAPGPLFPNFDRAGKGSGKPLTGAGIYALVRGLGKQVGIKTRPHGVRHTAITEALELSGGNYRAAQKFSRHADPRTLLRYDDNREDLGGKIAQTVAASFRP